ncbi:MAG TPA: hypothetical protein GYA03_02185, partial [Tissierellia bacterium]|nr:hypothetical protein [Tissierellia bacterium]
MSIKFDSQGCILALKQELMFSMKQLQTELLNEAKQRMNTPEGRESLTDGDITDIANVISVSIVGGAWAAMDEWGTGSLMDTSNPAFQDYRNSPLWNPARPDTKIRTRPAGPYTNIFGETREGRGKGGYDLEASGKVTPTPPSYAIQNAVRWMKNGRMQRLIKETIAMFNFGRFIITDKR